MRRIRTNQTGDAISVVFGLLVVALLVALGFIFYQNFIAKQTHNTSQPSQAQNDNKNTTVTSQVAFNSTIYELNGPTNWVTTTEKNSKSNLGGSIVRITNPDKTIRVNFDISELAQPSACNGGDGLRIGYYNAHTESVTKLADSPLYLVEAITDHAGDGYDYKVGLVQDSGDSHAAVGQSHCNVTHVGHASDVLYGKDNQTIVTPTILATIDFPKLPVAPKAASKDMQTIKDYLNSSDYKTAVSIIESAHKK